MKRHQKSFSVEIKKSRIPDQRPHLPPRLLFDVVPPAAEAHQILEHGAMPKVAEPTPARRILPSVVEPVWSRSEPAQLASRKRSSGETRHGQIEFDLNAASEGVIGVPVETSMHDEADSPTDTAAAVETDTPPTQDAQPASGTSAKSHERKTRTKASAIVEQARAPEPAPETQPTRHADMIEPSKEVPSRSNERRLNKRLAAAPQLPRSERWKRRLHPASW
jgi:hypothetical protein